MKRLVLAERLFLVSHVLAMAFGLAGLLLVLPHPEFIVSLSSLGQVFFRWGMAGGGVVYIILGAIAVSIYAYRTVGLGRWLTFMVPAVCLSLTSELMGTSTGFPFGHYGYLSGLGYKIAGLVPFTIPLSWFYLGFVSYVIALAGLDAAVPGKKYGWLRHAGAIAFGSLLLTSWDFVLDPAMSQTAFPFWRWFQPGAFFGMPYQNFAGWFGTGVVFMSVAALLWNKATPNLQRSQLAFPLAVYLSNFAFAAIMSIAAGFWIPVLLGLLVGVAPALWLWQRAKVTPDTGVAVPLTVTETSYSFLAETEEEEIETASPALASVELSGKS